MILGHYSFSILKCSENLSWSDFVLFALLTLSYFERGYAIETSVNK